MKKTVLIVEDQTAQIMIMLAMVEQLYTVVFARTIKSARELIKQRNPDLILLDNQLPDGKGLDLCSELKQDRATMSIPIVMVTSDDDEETEMLAFRSGVDDFIKKPISIKSGLARIKRFL